MTSHHHFPANFASTCFPSILSCTQKHSQMHIKTFSDAHGNILLTLSLTDARHQMGDKNTFFTLFLQTLKSQYQLSK